jgi:CheY-like chemotaxis protein
MGTEPGARPSDETHPPTEAERPLRRAWIVGGALEDWWDLGWTLKRAGIEISPAAVDADLAALGRAAVSARGAVVVVVASDEERGTALLTRLHTAAAELPLVAVVDVPALELVQRLRAAGASYVLGAPLEAERVREVLEQAFRDADRSAAPPPARPKILVVDDDDDYSAAIVALLDSQGYQALRAANGKKGLELALAEHPDLIVLDVMMENEWVGYELNQAIKYQERYESVRSIPILMVSSIRQHPADRFADLPEAERMSPDTYLTKPVDVPAFLEAVRALLALSTPTRAAPAR